MARTSAWPTVLGTAALIALPVFAAAQAAQASSSGSQASQPTAQSDTRYPVHSGAATQHLTEAKQVLDGIARNAMKGRNAAKLNEIRREFASLQRSYEANPSISAESTSPSASPKTKRTAGHWNEHLMALDRDLTALLGPGSDSMSSSSTPTETAGTSGTTPPSTAPGSSSTLDPNVRTQLEEFRKHLSQFAAAASGTQPGGEMSSAESSSSTAAGTTGAASSTATPTGSTTGTATSSTQSSSATGETAQAQSSQAAGSGTQADTSAARQHLTQARQSLADLTALPQAQQLQGDARTQVSQLISQFNQLITTQEEWRASYDQVNATLTTLLSGSAASSSSSSTQGAVGTTGSASASGTITLDPAIRTKLEEFRTHLQAFYSAAGGEGSGAPSPSAAGSSSSMSSTGSTSAASAAPSAEADTHIEAIERILAQASGAAGATSGTAGTSTPATSPSSVTLTKEQIDQIRMHLQQLKVSIKK